MRSNIATNSIPRLHLTSPVLAAARQEHWDPAGWESTCLRARAANLLKKIGKLQSGTTAHASGPSTTREADERLEALLARTRRRENRPMDAARDLAASQSARRRTEAERKARAWLSKLRLPITIGGR
jgi:hypothetical protein